MKNILIVFGTRPEAIKMAPLVKEFEKHKDRYNVKVCVTAQHREMLDQVLSFFDIKPDFDLNLMKPGQNLHQLTADVIMGMKAVFDNFRPSYVFIHGDTTTSAATAISAFYSGILVAHVEAGLRTYNKLSPFPEEINRQISGRISDLHFTPTPTSKNNLLTEKTKEDKIFVTGNTVIDALILAKSKLNHYQDTEIDFLKSIINENKKLLLVTGHRRENFGEGFLGICEALKQISNDPDVQIIYPVHLNPNVQTPVYSILGNLENVSLIKPLSYPAFVWIMQKSYIILTDSGGVQEEAPSLGKPVLVMRDTTERPEAVEAGTVKLVGSNPETIVNSVLNLLKNKGLYTEMSLAHNPYGDGKSCEKIIEILNNETK